MYVFIDTVFDDSEITFRGAEKSCKLSSASMDVNRILPGIEKMERKSMGRKMELIFFRQLSEYECGECGKIEDQTKELLDGSKMVKVLKNILYSLFKKSPDSLHQLALVGYLLFDTKFTIVIYDSPAGYVCRINHKNTLEFPEEADDICNALLPILIAAYKTRLMMENTNKKTKSNRYRN